MAEKFHRATFTRNFLKTITRIKNPDEMLADAKSGGLEKTLGVWDLIILGVGAIIGSGIFAVVGIAAAGNADGSSLGAGPGLVISMIVAAIACVFSALCYSEFATMIPVAGGAYTYTFATLGEFAAWMVGWVLMLEYAIGFIAVACAWSNHFVQFMSGFGVSFYNKNCCGKSGYICSNAWQYTNLYKSSCNNNRFVDDGNSCKRYKRFC